MKLKTATLTGPALDWAVAKCEGQTIHSGQALGYVCQPGVTDWYFSGHGHELWSPSTDWSQGGPIIEREVINLETLISRATDGREVLTWHARMSVRHTFQNYRTIPQPHWGKGPTPLIAAMRCYVVSNLGDEVDVPEELLP